MAVESGERWNGWLGLTHSLIYPWCPCKHSGEIHYLTSSITSHGQGKKPTFHADTHPRDQLRRLTQWGRGSRRNVVTHREQKCLGWGMGYFKGAVQGITQRTQQNTLSTLQQLMIACIRIVHAVETDVLAIFHMSAVSSFLCHGWVVKR